MSINLLKTFYARNHYIIKSNVWSSTWHECPRIFGWKVLVPIILPKRTKMGPQRQGWMYVGCASPDTIWYLNLPTWNLMWRNFLVISLMTNFFFMLDNQPNSCRDLSFNTSSTPNMFPNPHTQECEREVECLCIWINQWTNYLIHSIVPQMWLNHIFLLPMLLFV